MTGPLEGRVIVLTRAEDAAAEWCARLSALGAEVVTIPCVRVEPVDDAETRDALLRGATGARWLAFTSRNAVRATVRLTPGLAESLRVACIGPSTAGEARRSIGRADLVSPERTAGGLARALVERLLAEGEGGAVLFPAADRARPELSRELERSGIECRKVVVYRTVPVTTLDPQPNLGRLDSPTLVIASPSALEGFLNVTRVPPRAKILTTGPTTSRAVREAGLMVWREARTPSIEAIVAELR